MCDQKNLRKNLKIDMRYGSASGSLFWSQSKAITSTTYFGYVFGDIGLFVSASLISLLNQLICLVRSGWKKQHRRSMKIGACVAAWSLAVLCVIGFMIESTALYAEKKTGSRVVMGESNFLPDIIIMDPWVSNYKVNQTFADLPEELWQVNYGRDETYPLEFPTIDSPTMCHYLQSMFLMFADSPVVNMNSPLSQSRFKQLAEIVDTHLAKKGMHFIQLSKSLAHDASEIIANITTSTGDLITYDTKTLVTAYGIGTRIVLHPQGNEQSMTNLNLNLIRHPESYKHCSRTGHRSLVFDSDHGSVGVLSNYVGLAPFNDYQLDVRRQLVELKNRRSRPCLPTSEYRSNCFFVCLKTKIPCSCHDTFATETGDPIFSNTSKACHLYQPKFKQCPLTRFMNAAMLKECERECIRPCRSTVYDTKTTLLAYKRPEIMEVSIDLGQKSMNSQVEEFYVYDIEKYLCALCACISMIFGFSFISIIRGINQMRCIIRTWRDKYEASSTKK